MISDGSIRESDIGDQFHLQYFYYMTLNYKNNF